LDVSLITAVTVEMSFQTNFRLSQTTYYFAIDGVILPNVREVCDLGIIIDSKLSFSAHYAQIVSKRACMINRCFKSKDPHLLLRAFNTYVRPLIEYCSPV